MVDNEDDDSFLQAYMARARERQEKLARVKEAIASTDKGDVSYPDLSPLPEENDREDEISYATDKGENSSPVEPSELNYSSDLSLDCEGDDVYRAEPVVCHSSPEHFTPQYRPIASPKKQAPMAPPKQDFPAPLQERQPEQKATSSQSLPEMSPTEQCIKNLQNQIDRAEQTRNQLKKVVEISKYGSKEHIEAARLLQIAEIEHLTYTNSMAKFKQGLRKKNESLGSIKLSNIRLRISPKLRDELAEDTVSHYFFCIASNGTDVKSTGIINTNDIRRQDLKAYLQFREKIEFADLPPDFVLKVEIYELVTGQHLPKLLYRLTPSKKSKITPESTFKRVGSLKLTIADRDINYKNLTQWSKLEESKYIERECKFLMELKPEQLPCKSGMLHVRCLDNEGRPDWSRFWVDLSGQVRFWKSKQDSLDGKKPNHVLDFSDICSEKVQKLTPDDDLYRQNSFVIYSVQLMAGGEKDTLFQRVLREDPKYKLVKHQLAAENKEDRDSWCSILDRSLQCFREWHGKTKIYSIDETIEIFSSS